MFFDNLNIMHTDIICIVEKFKMISVIAICEDNMYF